MKLYAWQKDCLEAWEKNRHRGILHVVTGAGKTVFALEAIDRLCALHPNLRIRIVVPTIPLASQWQTSLLHHVSSEKMRPGFFGNETPGLYGGGRRDEPERQVMIYVVNSARDALAGHIRRDLALNRPVFLICDECHHYQSPENRKIFSFLTPEIQESSLYCSLGLSATPFGTSHDEILVRSLGKEIYRYDFQAAVRDGVISSFIICEVSASFFPEESYQYAELSDKISLIMAKMMRIYPELKNLQKNEFIKRVTALASSADMDPEEPAAAFLLLTYQRKEIANLAKARVQCAASLIRRLPDAKRILVFCERIQQAEEMLQRLRREYGSACGLYHSQMLPEARQRVLNEFRDGRVRILVSCRCLDEGVDVPDADIGIVLSSSAVERQRIQRLGRVIRKASGKDAACLYYIYIRESTDDAAYLAGLDSYDSFSIRYYTVEDEFSSDLYEYAAGSLLSSARLAGYRESQFRELRRCLAEGITRPDYLLPEDVQTEKIINTNKKHEKNYWMVMKKMGSAFRERPDSSE